MKSLIINAKESISVLSRTGIGFINAYAETARTCEHTKSLTLRCLLSSQSSKTNTFKSLSPDGLDYAIRRFQEEHWIIKVIDRPPTYSCVIADKRQALLTPFRDNEPRPTNPIVLLDDRKVVKPLATHFDMVWRESDSATLMYEDLLQSSLPEVSRNVASGSKEFWDDLIDFFTSHPEELHSLNPRKFEELIAEMLAREGMRVELTPAFRDGGRDILAYAETSVGRHLYLIECKRYAKHNPVAVSLVRALYGIVEAERATSGLLVTTSSFTKGALEFQRSVRHRLSLKDHVALKNWLQRFRS